MTRNDKPKKKKRLRNKNIIADHASGLNNNELSKKYGLSTVQVSRILNSDEVKEIVQQIDNKLAAGVEDAIRTLLVAVRSDVKSAIELLRNFGSMRVKSEIEHSFPEPTIIEKINGDKIFIGAKDGDK